MAISCDRVSILTLYQEIAPQAFPSVTTACGLAMTDREDCSDSPECGGRFRAFCGTARRPFPTVKNVGTPLPGCPDRTISRKSRWKFLPSPMPSPGGRVAPKGSGEECGRQSESQYKRTDLIPSRTLGGGLQISVIVRLPPAFLISHGTAYGGTMTASPRGKRWTLPRQRFLENESPPRWRWAFYVSFQGIDGLSCGLYGVGGGVLAVEFAGHRQAHRDALPAEAHGAGFGLLGA